MHLMGKRKLSAFFGLAIAATAMTTASAQQADHPDGGNLVIGMDVGERPFAFSEMDGTTTGVSYDIAVAIAKKLGRPGVEVVDVNFSSLFAAMFAKRFEFSPSPIVIRPERADQMLFTEPFMPTGQGFAVRRGDGFKQLEGLKGKRLAVTTGGSNDVWAAENAAKYGFKIERYNKTADVFQAIASGRADAGMTESSVANFFASQSPNIEVTYVIDTGLQLGMVFRKEDEAFRDKVEVTLECMKTDGTMAGIYKKWFGTAAPEGSIAITPQPGYGAEGFAGFRKSDDKVGCR